MGHAGGMQKCPDLSAFMTYHQVISGTAFVPGPCSRVQPVPPDPPADITL